MPPVLIISFSRPRKRMFVMHFAASGAEALDRLAEEIQPRLAAVLSDINMPGMDGLELLGEIKQRRPDLPVMMVTAYGDDERRRRAAELGAVEFITKPVDFDQLKGAATLLARRSRLRLTISWESSVTSPAGPPCAAPRHKVSAAPGCSFAPHKR